MNKWRIDVWPAGTLPTEENTQTKMLRSLARSTALNYGFSLEDGSYNVRVFAFPKLVHRSEVGADCVAPEYDGSPVVTAVKGA